MTVYNITAEISTGSLEGFEGNPDDIREVRAYLKSDEGLEETLNVLKQDRAGGQGLMAKFRLTAIVNTTAMDIDHLVDTSDMSAVQEFLETGDDSPPLAELWNMKLERIEE